MKPGELPPPSRSRLRFLGYVVVLAAAGLLLRAYARRNAPPPPDAPTVTVTVTSSEAPSAPVPSALRCDDAAPPFVIGEAPHPPSVSPSPSAAPSPAADPADETEDDLAPFAVEVGQGTVFDGGFAAGALRDADGGSVAIVATLGFDGTGGKLVRLGRSRGDLDPPVVAGAGASVLAAMVQPNASGRVLKIAKVTGDDVAWGAEIPAGRDESLAVDLAASGPRAVLVWSDSSADDKHSSIMLASFDVATLRSVTRARPVSPPSRDADTPRLKARPGGTWLAYLVRGEDKKKKAKATDDDEDTASGGEPIINHWVEVVPLDEDGAPAGAPRAVTPRDGHVLAYDLELGDDGSALVAWRDDDTPSGSGGGRLSVVVARPGGVGEARVLEDEGGGAGVPDLLPGWLAVTSATGRTKLAPMNGKGELGGELGAEASLGSGELLAAARDVILVARTAGKAMKLGVVRCAIGPGVSPPAAPVTPPAAHASAVPVEEPPGGFGGDGP
jgi:hypothetical protein